MKTLPMQPRLFLQARAEKILEELTETKTLFFIKACNMSKSQKNLGTSTSTAPKTEVSTEYAPSLRLKVQIDKHIVLLDEGMLSLSAARSRLSSYT